MSDAVPSEPTKSEGSKPDTRPPKLRRWLRRLGWTALVVLALALIFRLVLQFALPSVINKVGNYYGVNIVYDRLQLSLLGGQASLWDVSISLKSTGQEVVHSEYVSGNISVLELLKGQLHVWRAEVDGTLITLVRESDGSIPLITTLLDGLPKSQSTSQDLDLTSPLRVDAIRLHKIDLHFQDKSVTPNVDTLVRMAVRVSHVAAGQRKTQFEIEIAAQPMLDYLRIEGEGVAGGPALDARVMVTMRGLHPGAAAGYLRLLGLEPQAYDLSAQLAGHASLRAVNPATTPDTRPSPGGDKSMYITGKLLLDDAQLTADGEPALSCKKLSVDIDRVNLGSLEVSRISIDGVEAHARRTADAKLQFAGLQLGAAAASTRPAARAAAPQPVASSVRPFRWSVAEIAIGNVRAALVDDVVRPAASLEFGVRKLRLGNIIVDPDRPDAALDLSGQFELPNLARSVTLAGSARPFAARKTAQLAVNLGGLKPDAVRPYLDILGLESQFKDGSFACKLNAGLNIDPDGRVNADLGLSGLTLKDGSDLLKFDDITLAGLSLSPDFRSIDIRNIELTGPTIVGTRDKLGRLEVVGLRTAPIEEIARRLTGRGDLPATRQSLPVQQAMQQLPIERLSIGKLTWHKVGAVIEDRMAEPPVRLQLQEFALNAANLHFDFTGRKPAPIPGTFEFRFAMPGVARSFTANGSVLSRQNTVAFKVFVDGQGLSPDLLAPYIKPTGIEPVLRDGAITLQAQGTLAHTGNRFESSVVVEKLKYSDGANELAALDQLDVDRLSFDGKNVSAEKIELTRPRASVLREKDGSFVAGGIRVRIPSPPESQETPVVARAAATRPTTRPTQPLLPTLPFEIAIKQLRVKDAALSWQDQAVSPPVRTAAGVTLELDDFAYGPAPKAARLAVQLKADGTLDLLDARGDITLSPTSQAANLDVTMNGLRAGSLKSYLPPGFELTTVNGQLKASINAALSVHPQGGYAGNLFVRGLNFTDGQASLLKIDSFRVIVDRADLPDTILAVKELTAAGVETDVEITKDSSIRAVGVLLSQPSAPAQAPLAPAAPVAVGPAPAQAGPAAPPAAANLQDAAALAGRARKPLPQITFDVLDLRLKRATLTNSLRPGTAPITLGDLRFHNLNRIDVLGPDAADKPATSLQITGRLDPLVQKFDLRTDLRPFADEPHVKLSLIANGLRGEGLTALAPELKPHVDTSALRDGQFKTDVTIELAIDRRTGLNFDLSRGFGLNLIVRNTEFRAAPDGPVLAGLESLELNKAQVRPKQGAFTARSLELTKPQAAIHRDAAGIHALGLVIKVPGLDPAGQPASRPAEAAPPAPAVVTAAPAQPPPRPSTEIRLDRLTINGLDVTLEDRTFTPPVLVPLKGMDLEARGLSNLVLFEDRPVRFSLLVNSGKVPLPRRRASKSNVEMASLKDQTLSDFQLDPNMEDRELFSQVAASGRLSLYPTLNGYAKGSVSGFEIVALRGIAQTANIKIGGGTFDGKLDAVFPGDGSIEARLGAEVTQLRVREPKGGAIEKTLQLPAPLDIVLVGLEDADDSIGVRVPVKVEKGQLNKGQIVGAAVAAFAGITAKAVAAAPMKVLKVGTSLVGLDLGKRQQLQPVSVVFPMGYTGVEHPLPATYAALIKGLKDQDEATVTLRHDLGDADVQRVSELVNPASRTDVMALRDQIKRYRLDLFALRAEVAGAARAQLAAGLAEQAELTLQRLRGLEAEIASNDNALDQVYEMLRDGGIPAPLRERRTRAGSLTLGQDRLAAVRQLLISQGIQPSRIDVIAPTYNPRSEPGVVTLTPVQKKKQ